MKENDGVKICEFSIYREDRKQNWEEPYISFLILFVLFFQFSLG